MGALSVPPLVSETHSPQANDEQPLLLKPKADCQQSTLALGTTPSGCTQRAPANTEFIRHTQWVTNINSGKEKFLVAYPTEQTVVDWRHKLPGSHPGWSLTAPS